MSEDISSINTSRFLNRGMVFLCLLLAGLILFLNLRILHLEDLASRNDNLTLLWEGVDRGFLQLLLSDGGEAPPPMGEIRVELEQLNRAYEAFRLEPVIGKIPGESPAWRELSEALNRFGVLSDGMGRREGFVEEVMERSLEVDRAAAAYHDRISAVIWQRKTLFRLCRNLLVGSLFLIIIGYSFFHNARVRRSNLQIENLSRFMRENPDPVLRVTSGGIISLANNASLPLLQKWQSGIGKALPPHVGEVVDTALREKSIAYLEETVGDKAFQIAAVYISGKDYLNLYGSNITELRRIQGEIQQKQKLESLGLLAGGIAHDFNNLLAGIMNASQLIRLEDPANREEIIEYADMIIEASEQAADLTRKLLEFSRSDRAPFKTLDLGKVLEGAVAILRQTVGSRVSVTMENRADHPYISGDRGGLQRLFLNMGINANQAMPDGGVLTFRLRNVVLEDSPPGRNPEELPPGEYCLVEIEDTGVGIPRDRTGKIFEPFYTTKKFGDGAGLGLSTSYGIIQGHGGLIDVFSEVDRGTRFQVYLPCTGDIPSAAEEGVYNRGRGRILLVDDESLVRLTTEHLLTGLGYEVVSASGGAEAVELFRREEGRFDLVITDFIMPGMNGRDVAREIRGIRRDCPVLLSSGFSNEGEEEGIRDGNIAGFLKKPYRDYQIGRVIHDLMQRRE